jgi:NOL1/NOP2/fmu family ribosome biogenesis protein
MKIQVLDKTKKKKVLEGLSYVGDLKMNELFIRTGDRIRIFTGNLTNEQIMRIWSIFQIEGLGLYFAKDFIDKRGNQETRISLDGLHSVKNQINKNIIEIEENQKESWLRGNNLELNPIQKEKYSDIKGFVAIKYNNDFIGTAKLTEQKVLLSFLPKERRIKN